MDRSELTALVALLRLARRAPHVTAELIEAGQTPTQLLEHDVAEDDAGQSNLFTSAQPAELLDAAAHDVDTWEGQGMALYSVIDPGYPNNLRAVHDRPPLLFVAGQLEPGDSRSIAVIGSRQATQDGLERARTLAGSFTRAGYTVVSGLAAGVDTAAHTATLNLGGRTVAVIGTGLARAYPPANAELQREIATRGAVVSQFWPDAPPRRESFPLRNATMSGLALATVIVEASVRSGARIQARRALAHGRPVFMAASLLEQPWAAELAQRSGVAAFETGDEILTSLERLNGSSRLTA